ncbi:hypothetical protein N5P37_012241 [Trichoderma harzianum]|nr:hypothetical protein N5P37_012241 [Trichoderma harzianum]
MGAWNNNGHGGTPYWQVLGWHVYPTRIFNHLNGGGTPNDVPSSHGLYQARYWTSRTKQHALTSAGMDGSARHRGHGCIDTSKDREGSFSERYG